MEKWNQATITKYTLQIACKHESLWVKWIQKNVIKDQFFWTMRPPEDCSWIWRGILQTRDQAKKFTRYQVADGKNSNILHEPMAPTSLHSYKHWRNMGGSTTHSDSHKGRRRQGGPLQQLAGQNQNLPPHTNAAGPKICNEHLYNDAKMRSVLPLTHTSRAAYRETVWHLFFECEFSSAVWQGVMKWCGSYKKIGDAVQEWKWLTNGLKEDTFINNLYKMAASLLQLQLQCTCYGEKGMIECIMLGKLIQMAHCY
ncbi:hypothetical protein FRX31_034328 [Thalictrum thalictroides]|uniref:Uncharacterized protein n=1 Tax=Thalictrum thalictroides TaxID=46969 RepID=A0A7J6UV61_THATH|nr:hypothetical protein FRX31_034328 [Thalictrum thalictroides]